MARRALPVVALVGRPNVGKSTLFNRITRTRRAIVTAIAGTTRDGIAQPVTWEGVEFSLADTGGVYGASEDPLHHMVHEQGRRIIESANLLILVVDGRQGRAPGDEEIVKALRAANVPIILAINKMDDKRALDGALELFQLGLDPIV